MAAAGAQAARCLTVLLTLAVLLGHGGQELGLRRAWAAAVNLPSNEELTSSLLANKLAILQLLQGASNAASACPDGWLRHESSCYLVDDTRRNWEESLGYCKGLGGDLAKITSAEKHEFIKGQLQGLNWVWIGLNDRTNEGDYVWTDGSAATYTAWREGQPNDDDKGWDCVYMNMQYDYKWLDFSCNDEDSKRSMYCVCERPVHT